MINCRITDRVGISEEDLPGIKNIIFDLGGVIIDIRYNETIEQFKKLGFTDFETMYTQMKQSRLFELLETGKIPAQAFRMELRKYQNHLTDEQIDEAWNAMIGEMPENHIPLLKNLRQNYRVFLLSNTNSIHIDYFIKYLEKKFGYNPLPEMFEHTYYSHEMGYRKPNADIFENMLMTAGIKPGETLFIDDLGENVKGAQMVGLHAYHLVNESITNLFCERV